MNLSQRLLSNTVLIFFANASIKVSDSLLFIFIGRLIGPNDAGVFNLGKTYLIILVTLSAWGLHELLIRELAPRREQGGRYLTNYLFLRLSLATIAYIILLAFLSLSLPYTEEAKLVVRILCLTIFPESIFSLIQSFFIAHEKMIPPLAASSVSSILKLGAGFWLLSQGYGAVEVAWVIPISMTISLLVFLPPLIKLLVKLPRHLTSRIDIRFSLSQLRFAPGFIIIGLFATLDFQTDSLLISLLLDETSLGWYGAAQTIMLGFWLLPIAIRTAIYPIMARYYQQDQDQLIHLYRRINRYLVIAALPIATTIALLARPIILFVFGEKFLPAVPALQIMIWAVVFAFLDVPNARIMLITNRQGRTGWITGLSMATNVLMNLLLTPQYGILGAAFARTGSSFVFFLLIYWQVQKHVVSDSLFPLLLRPALASLMMALVIWQLRPYFLLWPILAGVIVYATVILLLGAIPIEDLRGFVRPPWKTER